MWVGTTWLSWLEISSEWFPFLVENIICLVHQTNNDYNTFRHISLNSLSLESVTRWVLLLLFTHVESGVIRLG
jgi:hypothetical protein